MSKAYRIFVDHKNAKKFAEEHNGKIIVDILGTGRKHYEVEYEDEEEGGRNELWSVQSS